MPFSKKRYHPGTHKGHVIFILIIPLILLLSVVIAMHIDKIQSRDYAIARAEQTLSDSSHEQTALFKAVLEGQFDTLRAFSGNLALYDGYDISIVRAHMRAIIAATDFTNMAVVDASGKSYYADGVEIDVPDRWYYRENMAGRTAVELIENTRNSHVKRLVISVPIIRNGTPAGALVGAYSEETFRNLLISNAYGRKGYSFICDPEGRLIVGPEKASVWGEPDKPSGESLFELLMKTPDANGKAVEEMRRTIAAGESGLAIYYVASEEPRAAVYEPLGVNDWYIFNVVPKSIIDDEVEEATGNTVVLYAIIVGACLAMLCFVILLEHRNADDIKKEKERYRILAEYDSLTGLYNKETFAEIISKKIIPECRDRTFHLIVFDIDRMKLLNDLYGYAEGDRLLQYIGKMLKEEKQSEYYLACRISSDNFAFLLPYEKGLSEKIIETANAGIKNYGLPFNITLSCGIYVINDLTAISVNSMVDRATIAKNTVKGHYGLHYAYYDEKYTEELHREQDVVGSMESALENGEFTFYLQPQYSREETEKIVGAEALVRWIHPTKGVIPPAEFVPIFERNGFISKMDEYIWDRVCATLRKWLDEGYEPVPLSINVSRMDIYNPDLCAGLGALIGKHAIPPRLLKLEITETAYVGDPKLVTETVRRFKEMGFVVEMDDFGSGHSSLNTLKDVPVDTLKLDAGFLSMRNEERGSLIIQSVVRMAKGLGLNIVAEGVETKEQADYLMEIDRSVIHQGYFYAKPMPAEDFVKYLKKEAGQNS